MTPRPGSAALTGGERAYASAGLPGADWWVAGPVSDSRDVELDAVSALYAEYGLWDSALAGPITE